MVSVNMKNSIMNVVFLLISEYFFSFKSRFWIIKMLFIFYFFFGQKMLFILNENFTKERNEFWVHKTKTLIG